MGRSGRFDGTASSEGGYASPVSLGSTDQLEPSVQRSWPHSRCRQRAGGAYPASPEPPAPATTITRASYPCPVRPERRQAWAWNRVPNNRNGILMLAGATRMTTNHSTPMPSTTLCLARRVRVSAARVCELTIRALPVVSSRRDQGQFSGVRPRVAVCRMDRLTAESRALTLVHDGAERRSASTSCRSCRWRRGTPARAEGGRISTRCESNEIEPGARGSGVPGSEAPACHRVV